jgi:hypothetical protein
MTLIDKLVAAFDIVFEAAFAACGTFAKEVVFFSRSGLPVCLRGIFNTR